MAQAIFVVPVKDGQAKMPVYFDGLSAVGEGWYCIGPAPQPDTTIIGVIAPKTVIDAMKASPDYLFMEDL